MLLGTLLTYLAWSVVTGSKPPLPGEVQFFSVAPKIYVPFDPAQVRTVVRLPDLYAVELPLGGGYAQDPCISASGERFWFLQSADRVMTSTIFLLSPASFLVPPELPGWVREALRGGAFTCTEKGEGLLAVVGNRRGLGDALWAGRWDEAGPPQWRVIHASESGILGRPAGSPGAEHVAFVSRGRLWVISGNAAAGSPQAVLEGVSAVAMSAEAAFAVRQETELWRVPLLPESPGQPQLLLRLLGQTVEALDVDRKGERLAYVARKRGEGAWVRVVQAHNGRTLWEAPTGGEGLGGFGGSRRLRLSGDGRRLLWAGELRGQTGVWWVSLEPGQGQVRRLDEGPLLLGEPRHVDLDVNGAGEIALLAEGTRALLVFFADETPPEVQLRAPTPRLWREGEALFIELEFCDRSVVSGVDASRLRVKVDGEDITGLLHLALSQAKGSVPWKPFKGEGRESHLQVELWDRAGNHTAQHYELQRVKKRVELAVSGGVVGWRRRLVIYEDGWSRWEDLSTQSGRWRLLPEAERARLEGLLAQLEAEKLAGDFFPASPRYDGFQLLLSLPHRDVRLGEPLPENVPKPLRELAEMLLSLLAGEER